MTPGSATERSPWFLRPPAPDHASRLFCFPYSGIGASAFQAWPRVIGDMEVCPLQFPGRESRMAEPHYGTYRDLAAALVEPLVPRLDRPSAFFGHCAGALPAFETVVLLAELGLPVPDRLFVSGQVAPHDCPHDRMRTMTDEQLRAELATIARSRGIEPGADMIEMSLGVLRRDLAANGDYRRPEPVVVPCEIVVLHWRDDPEVELDQLHGWYRYSDSVEFRVVDGGHYGFLDAPEELTTLVTGSR